MHKTDILEIDDVLSIVSKNYPDKYCVFILPHGIVDAEEIIEETKLDCSGKILYAEDWILERYDNLIDVENRVIIFGKWMFNIYAACYKAGVLIHQN